MAATLPASDLSQSALGAPHLRSFGRHFIDGYGRIVQLRGVNVSGASKIPTKPDGLQHLSHNDFFNHKLVSFTGRPFSLSEAPFHFARLQAWGLTVVRLLITWESLAHTGPNPETDMDEEYVDYLEALIALMPKYGLKVIVCAHQDVWSRFSGGSGAPGWTFEKAGLDVEAFKSTGAAYVDLLHSPPTPGSSTLDDKENSRKAPTERVSKRRGKAEPVGAFVWPSGYQKLAAATMATLFWAGSTFAWKLELPHFDPNASQSRINIQEYLQASYIESFGRLMDRVGQMEAVMGVDLMNEPHRGYVGAADWNKWNYETDLHIGHFPSLLQSLALGSGFKQSVPFYVKSWPFPTRRTHMSIIDPLGQTAWLSDGPLGQCVWRTHGAWEWNTEKQEPVVLRQDFFTRDPRPGQDSRRIEWYRDCYAPFLARFTDRVRRRSPHLFSFVEPIPNEFFPPWSQAATVASLSDADRMDLMRASFEQDYSTKTFIEVARPSETVYAPHFYDLNLLFSKVYRDMSINVQGLSRGMFLFRAIYFGVEGLRKNYNHQIKTLKKYGQLSLGNVPMLIGEVGIPWDINGSHAFKTGDYSKQADLLEALIEAMEQNQVGFTLWNYNPDNSPRIGDGWNKEDFSITSGHDQHDGGSGGPGEAQADIDNRRAKEDLYRGGRCLSAIIRPYAVKVAGFPLETKWDSEKLRFEFHYVNGPVEMLASNSKDDSKRSVTEIFLPAYHYDGHQLQVQVKDGEYTVDRPGQSIYLHHANMDPGFEHIVCVSIVGSPPRKQRRGQWYRRISVQDACTLFSLAFVVVLCLVVSDMVVKPLLEGFETTNGTA